MSLRCMAWVFAHSEATGFDRLVLLAIADEANDDGDGGFPSQERLATKAHVSKRSVQRCVERLESLGELLVFRPEKRGRGHVWEYVVLMGDVAEERRSERLLRPPAESTSPGREKARKGAQRRASLAKSRPTLYPIEEAKAASSTAVEKSVPDPVTDVFEAWQSSTGKTRTVLDKKRRACIERALATYPLDDVLAAVRGWRLSAHHRGENDRRTVYNDLELLLRDAAHLERFRDLERSGVSESNGNGRKPSAVQLSHEAINRVMRGGQGEPARGGSGTRQDDDRLAGAATDRPGDRGVVLDARSRRA